MKFSLETKIWAGFVITLSALTVIGIATYLNLNRVEEANRLIRHSHEVTQRLNHVILLTVDVETGARGYLLTRDERQLIPYDAGRNGIDIELADLRQLISDNTPLTHRLDTLNQLVHKKITILERAVSLAKQSIPLADILKGSTGEGRITMEAIRSLADGMQKDETTLLSQRQETERVRSKNQMILMFVGNLLVLLVLGLAGFSIHRDIARRKKAERELQDGLTFLDSVVENIPNMIFVKDAEHLRFVRFNRAGEKLLGVTQKDMIGKSDYDFFSKDQANFFTINDKRVLAEGKLLDIPEETIETKDNGSRILHTKKIPVFDQAGQARYLLGISEDITEYKKAEAQINRFFELSVDLLCIANNDGYFLKLNPSWEKVLGFSTEELTKKQFLEFVHPDDREATLSEMSKLSLGHSVISFENRYLCKNGSYRTLVWNSSPSRDDGTVYAVAHDVTDRKKIEQEISALNQTLTQRAAALTSANKELESFSYSISHDLRTPLRSIAGFSQALLEDYNSKLDETGKDYLNRVRSAAQRMALLIDDILQLSRVTRSELNKQNVDISLLARNIMNELQEQHPDRQVALTIESGLTAHGDQLLLRAALENLLGNAWKYTSKTQNATIEFGLTMQDNTQTLFVRDNGVGFDMAFAGKLFGVFERLHTTDEFEGTGIGLATVKRIVNRHGGAIWVESAVNSGATFYFTLGTIGEKGANYAQQNHPPGRGQSGRRAADPARA